MFDNFRKKSQLIVHVPVQHLPKWQRRVQNPRGQTSDFFARSHRILYDFIDLMTVIYVPAPNPYDCAGLPNAIGTDIGQILFADGVSPFITSPDGHQPTFPCHCSQIKERTHDSGRLHDVVAQPTCHEGVAKVIVHPEVGQLAHGFCAKCRNINKLLHIGLDSLRQYVHISMKIYLLKSWMAPIVWRDTFAQGGHNHFKTAANASERVGFRGLSYHKMVYATEQCPRFLLVANHRSHIVAPLCQSMGNRSACMAGGAKKKDIGHFLSQYEKLVLCQASLLTLISVAH